MPSQIRHTCACIPRVLPPLVGLALLASACSNADYGNPLGPGFETSQFAKGLEVERANYRHVVSFATDSAELGARERDGLRRFLQTTGLKPGDVVRLEGHADERAGELYNLDLSAQRIAAVRTLLESAGYQQVEIVPTAYGERAPAAPGSDPADWRQNRRVEVVVERALVVLPECPDWSRESGADFANLPFSNLGCGVRTNQGLMVAEPRDLERGRRLGPADGVKAAGAIERYRAGEEAELLEEGFE